VVGGNSHQQWMVAANIWNKQSWAAEKRCSSRWEVGRGPRNCTDYLNKRHKLWKMDKRSVAINVRSPYWQVR
jgi:hypothetical protein